MSMTGAVQESLVTMCCFHEVGSQIAAIVPLEMFDAAYRKIASKAYRYQESFGKPPCDHTIDLIDELCEEDPDNAEAYKRLMRSMFETKDDVNADYIIGKAQKFVRQQRVKSAVMKCMPMINSGEIDGIEDIITEACRNDSHLFRPGLQITDMRQVLDVLHHQPEPFPTGIDVLDKRNIGPCRKELWLYVSPPKTGKTWHLVHLGKANVISRQKVLHVTLEMSEERMVQRYLQTLFSVSRRKPAHDQFERVRFEVDERGMFVAAEKVAIPDRPSFEDDDISSTLRREVGRIRGRVQLMVKQFPTGQLTIPMLKGYLDQLEMSGFIPDLMIVDYTDLMEIDPRHQWQCLGKLTQDLRGIAVERNIAVATASQVTRQGAKKKKSHATDVAGDWSKVATADTIVMYSQTEGEKRLQIARLDVMARNEEDLFQTIISQNYHLGQYCMQSAHGGSRYQRFLDEQGQQRMIEREREDDDHETVGAGTHNARGAHPEFEEYSGNGNSNGNGNGHARRNGSR